MRTSVVLSDSELAFLWEEKNADFRPLFYCVLVFGKAFGHGNAEK